MLAVASDRHAARLEFQSAGVPADSAVRGATASPQRGQVYRCDLGYGLKPWLVVSNNARNRLLDDIIAIRLTTTARDLPTWVTLSPADPLTGYDQKAGTWRSRHLRPAWSSAACAIP